MSHTCKAVAIRCIDFRLRTPLTEFFREQGLENQVDDPGLAGGVKDLVEPSGNPDVVLKQISVATALHGVSKVLLINHTDCGAYGGHGPRTIPPGDRGESARGHRTRPRHADRPVRIHSVGQARSFCPFQPGCVMQSGLAFS